MRPDLASDIPQLTAEHLTLVASAMAIVIALGVPPGILLTRRPSVRMWLLGFASVAQTIPLIGQIGH